MFSVSIQFEMKLIIGKACKIWTFLIIFTFFQFLELDFWIFMFLYLRALENLQQKFMCEKLIKENEAKTRKSENFKVKLYLKMEKAVKIIPILVLITITTINIDKNWTINNVRNFFQGLKLSLLSGDNSYLDRGLVHFYDICVLCTLKVQ